MCIDTWPMLRTKCTRAIYLEKIEGLKVHIKSILRPPYRVARWVYHKTIKRPHKSLGFIFMLHRVDSFEEGHLWPNEHMKVTPEFLDAQLATAEAVRNEIQAGLDVLAEKTGIVPDVFAYPFGSPNEVGRREQKVLSQMPFKMGLLAYGGACIKADLKNIYALPRVMFKQDFSVDDLQ